MIKQIKVGLVQIGERFGSQYYLPYSIGILQAYAQKHLKNPKKFVFLLPIYKRIKVAQAVKQLLDAEIVFFSTYIWNYRLSLEIAKAIKQAKKDCLIVFGGPQVPESYQGMEVFLKENPFIDVGCYTEGEIPFLKILENLQDRSWENIPSIGFINQEGGFKYNPLSKRIEDLNEIPSSYLEGVFDSLMEANPGESWSALIETNRGCPFRCTYCYWGKQKRSNIYQHSIERIFKEINWLSQRRIEFVFCCDANFGILERDVDIALKVSENKKKYGYPKAFSVQNTKNSTERIFILQKILNDSGLQKGVNLALQSVNGDTLQSVKRSNINTGTYRNLQHLFTKEKIATFSDIIIGLPCESYDTFAEGVSKIITSGQHSRIQFINLCVLENTEMAQAEYQKRYGLVIKDSEIISHHTSFDNEIEVPEIQKLVVGTNFMSEKDWLRSRVFAWMTSLLYFNKLLQIPFMLLNKIYFLSYRELTEIFMLKSYQHKEISKILKFFIEKARSIQRGGSEHIPSSEWLNIWWPADEYVFIKLCIESRLSEFYQEAEKVLGNFLKKKKLKLPDGLLAEAIRFNRALIKLPFKKKDLDISLNYNLFEIYHGVLEGIDISLEKGNFCYTVKRTSQKWNSWDEWLREVVWYGSKRGVYIYDCRKK